MHKIIEVLSQKIDSNKQKIDEFFAQKLRGNPFLIYNSVDLRHSQIKIAPVDTNCFPAGFNNLSSQSKEKAKIIIDNFFAENFPNAKKIIIIPEAHTRNLRYLENVRCLQEIIAANREVLIGFVSDKTQEIDLENGHFLTLHPVVKNGDAVQTIDGFTADVIVLNNDLTDGVPDILKSLKTPIVPSEKMGWHSRGKSHYFDIYNQVAKELADVFEIDPWLISTLHNVQNNVNFKERVGLESLAENVEELLQKIRQKYQEYGIQEEPYCYIKADNGTYGIAVWAVFSGEDVLQINKKERNKMNMLKGSVQTSQVIIQEGVKTLDRIEGKIAEPMIYVINGQVVGNLFRANVEKDEKSSLNSAGAQFFDLENLSENQTELGAKKDKITSVYSLISKLAALAAAIEYQQTIS
jgi:glutamate--cysteine ligase